MSPDADLAERAELQHGVISRAQAMACGLTASALARRLAAGRVVALHPGVYRWPGTPVTWEQEVVAACLACGPGTVASHRSAAAVWGLLDRTDLVEVATRRPRCPKPRGVLLHRSTDLDDTHTTVRRGLPVTNPLRTMVDLGAVVGHQAVEDALDRGLGAHLFSVAAVEHLLFDVARPGRRGCGVLRQVLDRRALGAARPDGLLEPRMARLMRSAGFPPAAFQHVVPEAGARVDFAYPTIRLAIEVDGFAFHSSSDAMSSDHDRHNRLLAAGWRVVRFTWPDVVRRPQRVTTRLSAVLASLGPETGTEDAKT
jgi:very-short-patch-repair endonuclease